MTITARLTLAMVALALATAAAVGLLTYRNMEAVVLPAELARLQEHAKGQAALIDEVISSARHDVKAFSGGAAAFDGMARARANGGIDPEDGSTEAAWRLRLARRLMAELQAKPDYLQLRFIGIAEGGRELLRVDRSGPHGTIRNVPDEDLQRKGDRDYFIETMKLSPGSIYLSRIDLNAEQGAVEEPRRPVIRIATPVQTPGGEPFGMLMLSVDLRSLFARVSRTASEQNRVFIVNADGYFLLHPEAARVFGFQLGHDRRLQNEFPSLAGSLGGTTGFVRLMDSPGDGPVGLALAAVRPAGGEWLAVLETAPRASLVATIAPVQHSSVLAGGVVTLLAAGLAVWLARSLARPVVTLTRAVEAFGAGESSRLTIESTGEIGQLARAFEKMRGEMETKTGALRMSEELFARSFQITPECVVISRLSDRTVIRANDAVCRLWGSTPEQVVGKRGRDFSNWLQEEERLRFMQTLTEKGECLDHETTLQMADGRRLRFNISCRLITFNQERCALTLMRDVTDRRRIEAAMRTSEERYRALFEYAPDGILIADAESRYLDANAAICRMLGYTREELLKLKAEDIVAPSEIPEIKPALDTIKANQDHAREWLFRRRDGALFPAEVIATLMPDGNLLAVIRDVSDRQYAAEAIRANREEFKDLFDNAPVGYHEVNAQGRIARINQAELEMLGYTSEELLGEFVWKISADPAASERAVFEKLSGVPPPAAFERVLRRKDGTTFPVLIKDRLVRNDAGGVVGIRANVQDITERKVAEHALRESEEHFRFLNDLGQANRGLVDPGQIMAVMVRMLGEHLSTSRCAYADVEQDGDRFAILHDYTDGCVSTVGSYQLSLFGARSVATLRSGQTLIIRDVDAELPAGEGAEMFNAIGIKAIITCPLVKDGVLRAMMAVHQTSPRDWKPKEIAMVQDVVERCWSTIQRRTAEEEIRQLNAKLEQRVAERTVQLEAANKELEAFSYSVSHDLRAPLRAVDGFSQAVLDDFGGKLPEDGQRYLRTIRSSAQRMGTLIDDLLAFSRLSRQALTKRPVDMNALVQTTLQELGSPWMDRRVEVRCGELPPCQGEPALLKQVWVNLISNALKYSRRREPAVIEIRCLKQDGELVYCVKDNGAGFDMRYAGALFGVFQRLHRPEDYEGTGVGLAIVQRVVQRHGGRIWAEAQVDVGATFSFTLTPSPS